MPYKSVDMEAADGLELGTVSVEVSDTNTASGGTPRQRAHTWTHTHMDTHTHDNEVLMYCTGVCQLVLM